MMTEVLKAKIVAHAEHKGWKLADCAPCGGRGGDCKDCGGVGKMRDTPDGMLDLTKTRAGKAIVKASVTASDQTNTGTNPPTEKRPRKPRAGKFAFLRVVANAEEAADCLKDQRTLFTVAVSGTSVADCEAQVCKLKLAGTMRPLRWRMIGGKETATYSVHETLRRS